MLFDSCKNVVLWKTLVFGNVLSFSYERLPLVEISANSSHIWGRKGTEIPQMQRFHGCCIATKTFETL